MAKIIKVSEFKRRGRARRGGLAPVRLRLRRLPWSRLGLRHVNTVNMTALVLPLAVSFTAWRHEQVVEAFHRLFEVPSVKTARSISGRAHVLDGDTLRIAGRKIRLHGMDAPELRQVCRNRQGRGWYCGVQARRHLIHLVGRAKITCRKVDTDRYGRMVAVCWRGKTDLGRQMVRDGWAVAYVRYSYAYVKDEAIARKNRRGIWSGAFSLPETWRHRHKRHFR